MLSNQITRNTLFYGDNLKIIREYFPDECIDLIYLDPPFNSNRTYNILFKEETGQESQAQIKAFDDTWHWNTQTDLTYREIVKNAPHKVSEMIQSLNKLIGENQMMAYLTMMTIRLIELYRVLKPTGSIYLHCDPFTSHYLKLVMDSIFGAKNFRREIIWTMSASAGYKSLVQNYVRGHDLILYYSKTEQPIFNKFFAPYSKEQLARFTSVDETGRKYKTITKDRKMYLDTAKGVPLTDVWNDIANFQTIVNAKEKLGYQTQKPLALLERIVKASSNEGDIILDPFCGCGTAIAAAEKLHRKWVGIDITHLAVSLQKYRLQDSFELQAKKDYDVLGEPEDLDSAKALAEQDRYQFQYWAVSLVSGKPVNGQIVGKKGKKGADRGVDGIITFEDLDDKGNLIYKSVLIQVKSGTVKSGDIRDFRGTIERENAPIGLFITLEEPTKPMFQEAISAGYYASKAWGREYPKIQILTIGQLLAGAEINMPDDLPQFKKAKRESNNNNNQKEIFDN